MWRQLAGGHHGDKDSDRTEGREAVEDFERFAEAGIRTFDTADIYGPSEKLIGEYLRSRGRLVSRLPSHPTPLLSFTMIGSVEGWGVRNVEGWGGLAFELIEVASQVQVIVLRVRGERKSSLFRY